MTFNHGVRSSTLRWITNRNKSELLRDKRCVRISFLCYISLLKLTVEIMVLMPFSTVFDINLTQTNSTDNVYMMLLGVALLHHSR